MKHRPERVSSLIQEELGKILVRDIEVDGAIITITGVEINKDLEHASVYIGVFPPAKNEAVMETLNAARQTLQWELTKKLNIRPMPSIAFKLDVGAENAAAVEKKLLGK